MRAITRTRSRRLILAALGFWIPVVIFASIANEILEGEPLAGDTAILQFIHQTFSNASPSFFLVFTNLGSATGICLLTSVLIMLCLAKDAKKQALLVFVSVAGAALANFCIKLLFQRDRPALWQSLVVEHSFSFPSGHAMASSALAFACMAVCWRTRWRWFAVVIGVIFMILVGFSRLFFGVHYPSDVVAGWMASLVWVTIVSAVLDKQVREKLRSFFERLRPTASK